MRVQLDHLQPTAVGSTVAAEAVLEKVEGRKLMFTVSVRDHRGLVACGKVTRVVVDTAGHRSPKWPWGITSCRQSGRKR